MTNKFSWFKFLVVEYYSTSVIYGYYLEALFVESYKSYQ